tara:strand:- start:389 stop:964 length:576 start_codon:yes stop_codon:yes gene_type:complete
MMIFKGRITSVGFDTGNSIVIGDWNESPLGDFTNIMWSKPDGTRVLLSPSQEHADFVSSLYSFDEVSIINFETKRHKRSVEVISDRFSVSARWGYRLVIPISRPLWFISSIENFFGKIIFGSSTYGIARDGSKEWYSIRGISKVTSAEARYLKQDLGNITSTDFPKKFGFSSPPRIPSSIEVRSHIDRDKV